MTLHDEEDGPPLTSNASDAEPVELACTFTVEGANLTHPSGTIQATPANGSTPRALATWNGTANGSGGWELQASNLTLAENGTYEIFLTMGEEHATSRHNATYEPCEEDDVDDESEQATEPEPRDPPPCPENVSADARENGDIFLRWQASSSAQTYTIYRANETGEFEHLTDATATTFADRETEGETTYEYRVVAVNEGGMAEDCATIEATAIPFFGPAASLALAAIGSVTILSVLRRRGGAG